MNRDRIKAQLAKLAAQDRLLSMTDEMKIERQYLSGDRGRGSGYFIMIHLPKSGQSDDEILIARLRVAIPEHFEALAKSLDEAQPEMTGSVFFVESDGLTATIPTPVSAALRCWADDLNDRMRERGV